MAADLRKVVLLGDGGVGKSALAISLTQNYFVTDYDPTIENSYRKQLDFGESVQMIDILDTAGQEDYSAMRDQYINSGDGFLLVYSVASKLSFQAVRDFHARILRVRDAKSWPCVIAANKCDLPANKREVTKEEGVALAAQLGSPFFETSAKDRINVEESFKALVQEISRMRGGPVLGEKSKSSKDLADSGKKKSKCIIL
jgi:GTPase KRas protein